MSHNVTERDGMFVVREPAWHNLVDPLKDYPTRAEAQKIAHPWEPVCEPLFRRVPSIVTLSDGTVDVVDSYEEVEGFQATVRSDDGHTLGVVGKDYEVVNNSVLWDVAESLEDVSKGSVRYETGGSLKGGSKVWLLVRLREPLTIKGDTHTATIPYFALQNSHDGSGAFRGQATMTRIVCDNTAQAADLDASMRGTEFSFRHTANVADRIEQAKDALRGWRTAILEYKMLSEELASISIDDEQRERFVEEFIPMPPPHTVSPRVVRNVENSRALLTSILVGPTCEDISNTAYGLIQAATEYQNHYRAARSAETRFERAYLKRSVVVSDAVKIAQKVSR